MFIDLEIDNSLRTSTTLHLTSLSTLRIDPGRLLGSIPLDACCHHTGVGNALESSHLSSDISRHGGAGCHGGVRGGAGDPYDLASRAHIRSLGYWGLNWKPWGSGAPTGHLPHEERVEEPNISGHLLHSSDLTLFLRVCEFHHKTRGGSWHCTASMQLCYCSLSSVCGGQLDERAALAVSVWATEYRALLDVSERFENISDLLFCLLLAEHPYEQLPVLSTIRLVVCWLDLEGPVHARQCDLLVESGLGVVGALPAAVGQEGTALVHPCQLVLQDGELVDLSKLFEHWAQIVVFQVSWDLTNKQLDCIVVFFNFSLNGFV